MRLLAALTFFTRLPFWRIREIPADAFKQVVPFWPLTGWLTGGVTALTFWLCSRLMPLGMAWILALTARLLLTGALHEDGFADFIDGFGVGTSSRERRLAIMKDSHIGTYGVIGLIIYYALMLQLPAIISREMLCMAVLCGDPFAKCCAAQLINILPYARNEEEAKNGVVYDRMRVGEVLACIFCGVFPLCAMIFASSLLPVALYWSLLIPVSIMLLLALLMKRKINGYTGDCCGAAFLLCELSFYLVFAIICNQ